MGAVRQHWGIENSLHWVLDVSFREDDCRIRQDAGAQTMSVLRHIALNLIRRERVTSEASRPGANGLGGVGAICCRS